MCIFESVACINLHATVKGWMRTRADAKPDRQKWNHAAVRQMNEHMRCSGSCPVCGHRKCLMAIGYVLMTIGHALGHALW